MLKLYTEGFINEIAKALQERLHETTRWTLAEMPAQVRRLSIPEPNWVELGYSIAPSTVTDGFEYAKELKRTWNVSQTYKSFEGDAALMFFPVVTTSNLQSAYRMFKNCLSLIYVPESLDFSKVDNISEMVSFCDALQTIKITSLSDGSSRTINGSGFADNADNLKYAEMDCKYVTTLENAFRDCLHLTYVDLGDTSSVANAARLFAGALRLVHLDFEPDWSSVVNANNMLNLAQSWDQDVDWDMPACKYAASMFERCGTPNTTEPVAPEHEFKIKINFPVVEELQNFCYETSYEYQAVTEVELTTSSALKTIKSAFSGCGKLTKCLISNTSGIGSTDPGGWNAAFDGCSSLTTLSEMDMSNAKKIQSTFSGCKSLTHLDVVDDSIGSAMQWVDGAFKNCYVLEEVPSLDLSGVTGSDWNPIKEIVLNSPALSDESLDKLLQSLLTVPDTYTGVRTLYWVGVRDTYTIDGQTVPGYAVDRIEALPHYQDFIDANWTIGYPVT